MENTKKTPIKAMNIGEDVMKKTLVNLKKFKKMDI